MRSLAAAQACQITERNILCFSRILSLIFVSALSIPAYSSLNAQSIPGTYPASTVELTPVVPVAERTAAITAPGTGLQDYTIFYLDTRAFTHGGLLSLDIQVSPHSATDGSFDLFPLNVPIPTRGRPEGALTGRYDVRRGSFTRIDYRFSSGQVFAFGLEGNWASPRGATGLVRFRAAVAPPTAPSSTSGDDRNTLKLSPASPIGEGTATIVAPGRGQHDYNIVSIDTRDFADGGVLDIDIQVAANSATDGSFDLFPGSMPIPSPSRPGISLAGRYDVHRGTTSRLEYRFEPGQVFAFGLEGNWFSPKGATGLVRFRASVHR